MILNLTDMHIEGAEILDGEEGEVLFQALENQWVDEAASIISATGASEVIVDIDEDYFEELQAELEDVQLVLGRQDYDECA